MLAVKKKDHFSELVKAVQAPSLGLRGRGVLLNSLAEAYCKAVKKVLLGLHSLMGSTLNPGKYRQQAVRKEAQKTRKREKARHRGLQEAGLDQEHPDPPRAATPCHEPPATPPRLELSQTYKEDLLLASQELEANKNLYPR
jgi:hypothetical protein